MTFAGRSSLTYIFILTSLLFTGCGTELSTKSESGTSSAASFSGAVHGGQQPVSGAVIQLFAVGNAGDGSAAKPLLTQQVLTDGNGSFSITGLYNCPSAATLVYAAASGGNPGLAAGTNNPNLTLMTALGPCGSLTASTFIQINELTTVAAVFTLQPYLTSVSSVGASAGDVASLAAAFSSASSLVNTATGVPPGPNVPAGYQVPTTLLITLGDIVAPCVNSAGGVANDGSSCGQLFYYATRAGATPPTDVVGALLHLAAEPGLNTDSLFGLITSTSPFQPTLAAPPSAFNIRLVPPSALTLSAPSLAFPLTGVAADPSTETLTLTNSGPADLTVKGFDLFGPQPNDFFVASACIGTLAAKSSCTVAVSYSPLNPGNSLAYLSVSSSDAASPVEIPLSGNSVATTTTISPPNVSPSTMFINQATTVTFTALYTGATPSTGGITLQRYNSSQQLVGTIAAMHDDGQNGDAVANDGIYTAQVAFNEPAETPIFFRVSALAALSATPTLSQFGELDALQQLSAQQLAPALTVPTQASAVYDASLAAGQDEATALQATVSYLSQQSTVAHAATDRDNVLGISILYTSGVLGHMSFDDGVIRGNGRIAGKLESSTAIELDKLPEPRFSSKRQILTPPPAAASNSSFTVSPSVITLSPAHNEPAFATSDEAFEQGALIQKNGCLAVTQYTDGLQNADGSTDPVADIAAFSTIGNYGLVLISAHGDTWFSDLSWDLFANSNVKNFPILDPGYNDRFGDLTVVTTGEEPTSASLQMDHYQEKLRNKEIVLEFRRHIAPSATDPYAQYRYAVTSKFFAAYKKFESNIIYVGSCRSAKNASLADALGSAGADTFFGYDAIVSSSFAETAGTTLITNLRVPGTTATAAYNAVPSKTAAGPVSWNDVGKTLVYGDPPATLTKMLDGQASLPTCVDAGLVFLDGAPGNLTISINGVAHNYTGFALLQTVPLPFPTSSTSGTIYTIQIVANGGFADFTLNLPTGFVFSNGSNSVSARVISFAGPDTFTFHQATSSAVIPPPSSSGSSPLSARTQLSSTSTP